MTEINLFANYKVEIHDRDYLFAIYKVEIHDVEKLK